MTKLNRIGLIAVATLMGIGVTTTAMAASKADCRVYAKLAVDQYAGMQARNLGCTGFRWHNWYDGHYQWCRSASRKHRPGPKQLSASGPFSTDSARLFAQSCGAVRRGYERRPVKSLRR